MELINPQCRQLAWARQRECPPCIDFSLSRKMDFYVELEEPCVDEIDPVRHTRPRLPKSDRIRQIDCWRVKGRSRLGWICLLIVETVECAACSCSQSIITP